MYVPHTRTKVSEKPVRRGSKEITEHVVLLTRADEEPVLLIEWNCRPTIIVDCGPPHEERDIRKRLTVAFDKEYFGNEEQRP